MLSDEPHPGDVGTGISARAVDTNAMDTHVDFTRMEPSDLDHVFVVAQCLDNQWVSRELLGRMLQQRLELTDVREEREKAVRAEYLRSLINASKVVVNRAYIYNNPAVYSDFLELGPSRDAFIKLLREQAIITYLFKEESPAQDVEFSSEINALSAWQRVCRDERVSCVRLSWDNQRNRKLADDLLSRRFHNFATNMASGDTTVYARDLVLNNDSRGVLKKRLSEIGRFCFDILDQDRLAQREELYAKFVIIDGTPPSMGKYDKEKLFAGEIKQLLDLCYNINLPDALGGFALTPSDSLPRTALQELGQLSKDPHVSADTLLDLVRQAAFSLVQGGLYLRSFGDLELPDVHAIRNTPEWGHYISSVEQLVANPLMFADSERGAEKVYKSYVTLAKIATEYAKNRRKDALEAKWLPSLELVIEIGGCVLSVTWSALGGILYQASGAIASHFIIKNAPVVARLVVRGLSGLEAQADLATSIDFMRARMDNAEEQWDYLVAKVRELRHPQTSEAITDDRELATINHPLSPVEALS